jgi:hypothetical protein
MLTDGAPAHIHIRLACRLEIAGSGSNTIKADAFCNTEFLSL